MVKSLYPKSQKLFNIVKSFCPKSQKLVLLANYFWGKTKKFEKKFFKCRDKKIKWKKPTQFFLCLNFHPLIMMPMQLD
jgi:hypothetical protein